MLSTFRRSNASRWTSTALIVALVHLPMSRRAAAHNGDVHRDMVDLSYQVMRLVAYESAAGAVPVDPNGPGRASDTPPGIPDAEWAQFLADIKNASIRLGEIYTDAKTPGLPDHWYEGYHEGGIYNQTLSLGPPDFESWRHNGRVLGLWAAGIDDENDDTHLWVRPTSIGWFAAFKAFWSKAWHLIAGAFFAAIICGWKAIFGGSDCVEDAKSAASETDVVSKVEGLIPGIGDWSGGDYTTVWHFINVQSSPIVENEYDDHQGLYYLAAAYTGPQSLFVPPMDPLDFGILVLTTATGLSLNYDKSNGPKRYQINGGNDSHRDTGHRTKGQWQFLPLGLTQLEPVDNLGKYGWDQFKGEKTNFRWLAWPLHAIGDACAPHHVIGVTGWGHRPYEDAEATRWNQIRYLRSKPADPPAPDEVFAQTAQARRILLQAFAYRKATQTWRAAHGKGKTDLPIRDLVTDVAVQTLARATSVMGGEYWPYAPGVSLGYLVGAKGETTDYYTNDASVDRMRSLLELGCGATVAFLTSAVEVLP